MWSVDLPNLKIFGLLQIVNCLHWWIHIMLYQRSTPNLFQTCVCVFFLLVSSEQLFYSETRLLLFVFVKILIASLILFKKKRIMCWTIGINDLLYTFDVFFSKRISPLLSGHKRLFYEWDFLAFIITSVHNVSPPSQLNPTGINNL
jgi:hypothetical protein